MNQKSPDHIPVVRNSANANDLCLNEILRIIVACTELFVIWYVTKIKFENFQNHNRN